MAPTNGTNKTTVEAAAAAVSSTAMPKAKTKSHTSAGLSRRGDHNAAFVKANLSGVLDLLRNQYDPVDNPNGVVILGVADNALMRKELVQWFNADRLKLKPLELTYGDRLFTSQRLVNALCKLFNEVPVGLSTEKPKLIEEVKPEHIIVGSGATGILDALFTVLCNPGDGVLLSVPYYNGFDHDLTARSEVEILPVVVPLPAVYDGSGREPPTQPSPAFTPDTVQAYEDALQQARKDGKHVSTILICNPHNPTGLIYPRETLIGLARLAAKEDLHLVMDEIYARSVFESRDIHKDETTPFETILSIDVEKEAKLSRSRVHVVTSASKDFGINGFRHGVYVNQGNTDAIAAMTAMGMLSQASSPAGALWYSWLEDADFLQWYFKENHRRMAGAYKWVTDWARHHKIPYVPANSGHFIMLDFQRFLPTDESSDNDTKRRQAEAQLTGDLLKSGVFIAPGAQYHHPIPGWFRLTIAQTPIAVKEGLARAERALGLEPFAAHTPALDLRAGMWPLPPSLYRIARASIANESDKTNTGVLKPTLNDLPDDDRILSAILRRDVEDLTSLVAQANARENHKLFGAIAHNLLLSCLAHPESIDPNVEFLVQLISRLQSSNPTLRGRRAGGEYMRSAIIEAEGAGESLLEVFLAELHTAILSLSTNTTTPQYEHQTADDAPEPSYWLKSLVYGTVLGRLFTYQPCQTRAWRVVEDLLVKGLLSSGPPALGTIVLVPSLLLTSAGSLSKYLHHHQGQGTHYLWYDDVRTKPDVKWGWEEVKRSLTQGGLDHSIIAAVGPGKMVPNQATATWELAVDAAGRKGTCEDRAANDVLGTFAWVMESQQQ